jgi:cell division transport system ATP-binding protein
MSSVIEFRGVSKVYNNGTEALHNINLQIEKGEFVFVVGSSGAGKSTFTKLITCEERPTSGKIFVAGDEVSNISKGKIPYVRRKMGIVFQDFRLIEHMSVYDNVAFAMRVVGASGRTIRKRVPYILSLVGLQNKAKHLPSELSGGERQRVGLARALVNNPSLIIADEPTGNIDPALSFEIVDLLAEINRRGTTIIMVTHEHSLVKHFHKRIIQIHGGQIVADTAAIASNNRQVKEDLENKEEEHYDEAKDETYENFHSPNSDNAVKPTELPEVPTDLPKPETGEFEFTDVESSSSTGESASDYIQADTSAFENYIPGSDEEEFTFEDVSSDSAKREEKE